MALWWNLGGGAVSYERGTTVCRGQRGAQTSLRVRTWSSGSVSSQSAPRCMNHTLSTHALSTPPPRSHSAGFEGIL